VFVDVLDINFLKMFLFVVNSASYFCLKKKMVMSHKYW